MRHAGSPGAGQQEAQKPPLAVLSLISANDQPIADSVGAGRKNEGSINATAKGSSARSRVISTINMPIFNRTVEFTLIATLLFASAQRLPAPISEIESPTPSPEQSAKPKLQRKTEAIASATRSELSEAEVTHVFKSAGYPEVADAAPDLLQRLRRYGIVTRAQLQELLTSSEIMNALKKIYIEELKRPADHPLDPTNIAEYGSFLFKNGVGSTQLAAITNAVRSSQEYKEKHAE
jgi:hypothetical protein